MKISDDKRTVMTLDAGGTNFVFSAIQGGEEIISPVQKPAHANNLELCLKTIKQGFEEVKEQLEDNPAAISFAFPGPANYPMGIIGDLQNLPAFRGGVPLGSILEEHFNIPVYINNDGDLFAYGEALAGILPELNLKLEKAGSTKRYNNLIGITLGTGFGAGIVRNGELFLGDNSMASEVWIFSNRVIPEMNAEEGVSTRAIQKVYQELSGTENNSGLMPKDIYEIASGQKVGNKEAAIAAFQKMGHCLGDTLANLLTLIDGIVVIGGGIANASDLYMPSVMDELHGYFVNRNGDKMPRLVQQVFNLDEPGSKKSFLKNYSKRINIPGTDKHLDYDPEPRLGIVTSKLGASKAISLGAYSFALNKLDV
jgi:glucokinase